MKAFAPTSVRNRTRDGFIVVAVLWILAALATLASIYSTYVASTVIASRVNDERIQTHAMISAAVELAAYQLSASSQEVRPTQGAFSFRSGNANVAGEFRSEAARIDLNAASKELLAGLFAALGARAGSAEEYAARIIGWRTNSREEGQTLGPEVSAYRTAGLPYAPREGPFVHVGELWLVLGIPPQLVERALPYVTVFSGRPEINVLEAAPLVLASLPGMTPERLNAVLNLRAVPRQSGNTVLEMLGPAQSGATIDGSKATRVRIAVNFDNGRRTNAAVVILILEDADEPYRVLSWRDDADGPIADEPPRTDLRTRTDLR
jgi:general secretion pathway protein K